MEIKFNCTVSKIDATAQVKGIKEMVALNDLELTDEAWVALRHAIRTQNIYKVTIEPVD